MPAAPAPDLDCVGVTKRFGRFVAVDDVSVQIPGGSFFSILGPSGCGKTTLLRMVAGFEDPDAGDIRIKGRSVLTTPPNRRNVKMVFQHLALFPMMNVAGNIAYGLRCRGAGRDEIARRVGDALDRVGLPGAGEKEINQLSGGQKQRVAIARCMVLDPDVLLLDEPLGALDLKLRERMKVELKLLQHKFDATFVYITHDQSEALVMSDLVAVMNRGKFEQVGPPRELYHNPRTAFVAGFVGDSNRLRGKTLAAGRDGARIQAADGLALEAETVGAVPAAGDEMEVFIRPESISVVRMERDSAATESGANRPNRLEAQVDSVLFNGANSRILARTGAGALMEAALPQTGGFADLRRGERVRLEWSRAQCKCFSPTPA